MKLHLEVIVVFMMLIVLGLGESASLLAIETGFSVAPSPLPLSFMTVDGEDGSMSVRSVASRHVDYTDHLIIRYKGSSLARTAPLGSTRMEALSARAGVPLTYLRAMSGNNHVLELPRRMTSDEAQAIAQQLSEDSEVEYAVPDWLVFPMIAPNDVMYPPQWHFQSPTQDNVAGINLPPAWDITTGSSSLVIGVIDTGIVNHVDLQGRLVPGYNFISDPVMAGNSIGRSADATDLGDWVTNDESSDPGSVLYTCQVTNSSWHGTHVAGTIGATTNNHYGVAGINWSSKILPVRVLGKCGGYLSDVIDGMRWAAGLSVPGVPDNTNPARVVNMSLGAEGACDAAMQNAINDVLSAGTVIVVAAGNSSYNAESFTPAGCTGVVSVAAVNRAGGGAYYTNYGQAVKIAAPGGERLFYPGHIYSIFSTLNTGTTFPIASPEGDIYGTYEGTSMAAPHVSGVVSLMLSLQPTLNASEVMGKLQATARPFPTATGSFGGDCTASLCGAGIVDAYRAVQAVMSNAPLIGATPLSLEFRTHPGDPNPPNQALAITNPGGGALNWSVSSNANWLQVSPTSGQGGGTVMLSTDISSLVPSTDHIGTITISAAGAANSPVIIPVTVKYLFTLRTPLLYPVCEQAQAAVDEKVYVIGGTGGQIGIVQIYDTTSDTWTTGTPNPTNICRTNAAVIDGKIYVPGGQNMWTGEFYNTLNIYDPATDQWSIGAPMPMPLNGSVVEAVDGRLYVIGGQNQHQDSYNSTYMYDPNTNTWTRQADMAIGTSGASSGVINGKIYVFGVGDSYGVPQLTEVYDPVANSWSAGGSLNIPRYYTAGAAMDGKLYSFGGYRFGYLRWRADSEIYDPVTDSWSLTPFLMNEPRYNPKAIVVGNTVYLMGGVRAISSILGVGTTINESYDMPIRLGTPNLVSPNNGATGQSLKPTLDWDDVSGATSYALQVCSDSACTSIVRSTTGLISSQWTVSPVLTLNTQYWWRVKAGNSSGDSSSWSSIRSFITTLQSFTLTLTETGTGNGAVTDNDGLNCTSFPCEKTYGSGTEVMLTGLPNAGSYFAGWSGDADCSDGKVTMDVDKPCTAEFELVCGQFNDVRNDNYAANYINALYCDGITIGCTQNPLYYCPSKSVTRAEMAAFIIRAKFGETFSYTANPYFADVPGTTQFFKYIQKMKDEGITIGCTQNPLNYCPSKSVTRAEMAAFIIRAKFGETFSYTANPYFADVPGTTQFFKYIQKMKDEGITMGCTATTYCPSKSVTRAEMAAFLARAFLGIP